MRELILVIEDNTDVRKNICEILESDDYQVMKAENGTIGLDLIQKEKPDLVLCDIMMPEMDGYKVLHNVRAISSVAATPFIFLTAKTSKEDMSLGMQLGADDYIMKPFTIAELLSRVRTRLDKRKEIIEKSEEKLQTLTDHLGIPITKELNEPLKTILGLSEFIINDYHSLEKKEMAEFVTLIRKAGLELNEVVAKTMAYYDLEKIFHEPGKLDSLKKTSTHVKDVLTKVAVEEANNFGRKHDLVVSIEDLEAQAPEDYFMQMMREVLNNAFKYSPKGTAVRIFGGEDNGKLQISISDEGIGFSEEELEHIGAYQTFHEEYAASGMGLGLQNAKRIAQLFDGSFHINSKKGLGTTVKIAIPSIN